MGIVSYAQNFEDVLLHRVFGSIHYAFYVDVGAYHPVDDSVTKTFYDRGWDGINIEPGDVFHQLAAARPRDINLHMAVYDRAGTIRFAQHPEWYAGLSHVAADAAAPADPASQPAVEMRTVPCDTLPNILDRYGSGRPIAFLKIDAEGSEEAIVRSTDWRAIRPTVILIEATKPRSTVLDNQRWEPVLLQQGYQRAYFDGINCYYVPEERADLLRHFELPVNVLDGYQRYDPQLPALRAQLEAAEAKSASLAAELVVIEAAQQQQAEQSDALQRELESTLDRLETARQRLEAVPAEQNAAIAAVVEAHAYQLADLRRQLAELDADRTRLRAERDAMSGLRAEAAQLWRLTCELRWPGGPGALRAVLPLARLLRRLAGTKVPPPPEQLVPLAPAPAAPAPAGVVRRPLPSIGRRAAWLAYRPFRPLGRPLAWRLRAFLTLHLQSEFKQLDAKLDRIRAELAQVPTAHAAPAAQPDDPRLAELQTEIRQFGKLLEDTLLTLALTGDARAID